RARPVADGDPPLRPRPGAGRVRGGQEDRRERQGPHRVREQAVKALVLHAARDARVEDRPEPPAPGSGDVTVRVVRAGLCGTDATEYSAGPVMTPLKTRHPASGVQGP